MIATTTNRNLLALAGLTAACALGLLGCPRGDKLKGNACIEDKDCGEPASAYRCESETGVCYCRTNDACGPRQFCNTAGFCQDKTGCEKNEDCIDPTLFCDTSTGTCLSKGRCTSDLHCPLGQVCDLAKSLCVEGCRTSGDCSGASCRCDGGPCSCTGTTQEQLASCEIGVCDPLFCEDNTFCKFGEQCGVPPDAGSSLNQCYSDYDPKRRPYCDNCSFGGGTDVCGTGANYCLIDTAHPGNYFCGADCSEGQSCPRGYACSDVIVVMTQWACTRSNPSCPTNPSLPCTEDSQCKRGVCVKSQGSASGFCAGKCMIDEGDDVGFCSCQVDGDCSQETCSGGECSISRKKCVTEQDCRTIHCVDFQGAGGCLIGQNCAPANGLSCLEMQ